MKKVYLIVIILSTASILKAQSVLDWYIPRPSINKLTFYSPNINSNSTDLSRQITYLKKGRYYEITDSKLFQGSITSSEIKTVEIKNTTTLIINKISVSANGEKTITKYPPGTIFFKLPIKGHAATWVINNDGLNVKYTSTWSNIFLEGKTVRAIKVTEETPGMKGIYIEYYSSNYGLCGSDIISGAKKIVVDKFKDSGYDESITTAESNIITLQTPIQKYQKMLVRNERPTDTNVQIKYDDKDYRAIIFSEQLSVASNYTREAMERLNYEYLGITTNDSQHRSYAYRSCQYSTIIEVTEWYNIKLVISLQWYSASVKNAIPYLRLCNQ